MFAPEKFLGLGLKHLFTMQKISRAQDFIYSQFENSFTGQLYESSLEVLLIEVGILKSLACLSYDTLGFLATDSLLIRTWEFLDKNQFQLHTRDFGTMPRLGNCFIMKALLPYIDNEKQLLEVNRCRLYLRVIYLSDIVTGNGKTSMKGHVLDPIDCISFEKNLGPTNNTPHRKHGCFGGRH